MVLPIIIGIAVIGLLITFREQIKAFADRSLQEKTPEEVEKQTVIDERGAFANTQAFILGEKGLKDLQDQSEANKLLINKFITDAQANLAQIPTGVSNTLVEAQKNLQTFADESKATIVSNVNQFQQDVNKNISGIGEGIGKFFEDSRINLENIFGGQAKPKPVATVQPFSINPTFGNITNFSPTGVRIGNAPINPIFTLPKPITATTQTKQGKNITVELSEGSVPEKELEVKVIQSRATSRATRFN